MVDRIAVAVFRYAVVLLCTTAFGVFVLNAWLSAGRERS
jgi:hypothetical protein